VLVYNALRPLPRSVTGNTGNAANGLVAVVFIVAFATVGALLAWKRPSNPIGWLLCATGACYAIGVFSILLEHFARTRADSYRESGPPNGGRTGDLLVILLLIPSQPGLWPFTSRSGRDSVHPVARATEQRRAPGNGKLMPP
jgi:hypothetical protein